MCFNIDLPFMNCMLRYFTEICFNIKRSNQFKLPAITFIMFSYLAFSAYKNVILKAQIMIIKQ